MKKKRRRPKKAASQVACPFCGEEEELFVDAGGSERQTYTEDCAVCCRPRVVHVEPGEEPGEIRVWLERGD
jgi:transcription elongation factor Elf1